MVYLVAILYNRSIVGTNYYIHMTIISNVIDFNTLINILLSFSGYISQRSIYSSTAYTVLSKLVVVQPITRKKTVNTERQE